MSTYGSLLIPLPLDRAAPVLREVCAAAYAAPAGPRFCLVHPNRFIDGNGVFSLAGPVGGALGVPVLAAFQYDGDRLELEVWRDGVRAHRYDSCPDRDDKGADGTPEDADPTVFLDFAAGPVDGYRLACALADTPLDERDMDVDGEPGYVWAQGLHWDVLGALGHPDQVISRAQRDHCHFGRAPRVLARLLADGELVDLGAA
ncbi:hypothetical protein ACRAWF_26465 [Streptomyces sp. L7]